MRIQEYRMVLDADNKNILVKEDGKNYPGMKRLDNAEAIVKLMKDVFGIERRAEEYVYLICMNTKCRPIGFFETSHGTCNMALVSPREILIRALLCSAANIVLVHNHPSGDPAPSREDDQMTRRIQTAADIIGIDFLDHIIIGKESYYSYCMNKRLENKAENSFVA